MYFSTADEMASLDDLAVEYGLEIQQMMELAGYHMVELYKKLDIDRTKKTVVFVGKGNKGGDGLSAIRHLINHGWNVSVILLSREIKPDPQHHLSLLEKMSVPITEFEDTDTVDQLIHKTDIILDALIGYRLKGAPYGLFKDAIEMINDSEKMVIAYDLPSGIDATTGECFEPCIEAYTTLTLALPKKLFTVEEAKRKSGHVLLGDIGIPNFLYEKMKSGVGSPFKNQSGLITV